MRRVWPEIRAVAATCLLALAQIAAARQPEILHTLGYGSVESGDPGDLLVVAGEALSGADRIVYQATSEGGAEQRHPDRVPTQSTQSSGVAPIIQPGNPASYLIARLPGTLAANTVYQLWAVGPENEWSSALLLNKPRPLWVTPPLVYSTADIGGVGRRIRVVGRNLQPLPGESMSLRLTDHATYVLATTAQSDGNSTQVSRYVTEAMLPKKVIPGDYKVSVSRDGQTWTDVPDQLLEVRADPQQPELTFDSTEFGSCRPNDGNYDDECLQRAINAARAAGKATIVVPAGRWDLRANAQFRVPPGVDLSGEGPQASKILRHAAKPGAPASALFILEGSNTISGVQFSEEDVYRSPQPGRAILQLGARGPPESPRVEPVSDVVIAGNTFLPVGEAIVDSGRPITRLLIANNLFGAYHVAIELPGSRYNLATPYRIDDSVIRANRFVPGSYLDLTARQGTIASELGASHRVDFSANFADGASIEALQNADDPKGWRAAFFWNMTNNHELLLVSENRISCAGDKVGDGEAIAFDGNGGTFAFKDAPVVVAATSGAVTVRARLLEVQNGKPIDRSTYYSDDWIQVVEGPGIGQVRQIRHYREDPHNGTVEFDVMPSWDIPPLAGRIVVGREYYQVYALANEIEQRRPTCTKGNLTGPRGGAIAVWGSSAGTVIAGNRQYDSSGIGFQQLYTVATPSCPRCGSYSTTQVALEIRENLIDGEYDWSSDCSWSGVFGSFGASTTPESTPPILGFNIAIVHNDIRQADGLGGGGIDFAPTWTVGPRPGDWPLIQGLAIYGNAISNMRDSPPRAVCHTGQRSRVGIRLGGSQNVSHAALQDNRYDEVVQPLEDSANGTVCIASSAHECSTGKDR